MRCSKCQKNKPLTEFYSRNNSTKYYTVCKVCKCKQCRSRKRAISKDPVKKKHRQDQNKKLRIARKQFVWNYLKEHPCVDCNETDPIVLDFDHVIGNKIENISVMAQNVVSITIMKEEIAKCEVRCSNCHRKKTAKQFDYYKDIVK